MIYKMMFSILFAVLLIFNIIFHCTGIYLLMKLRRNSCREDNGLLLIMNLSCVEVVACGLTLIHAIMRAAELNRVLLTYIEVVVLSGGVTWYYFSMICIVLDKLLLVFLNIRYPVYITEAKVKVAILANWMLGLVIGVALVIAYHFTKFN